MPRSYKVASIRLIPKVDGTPSIDLLQPITLQSCVKDLHHVFGACDWTMAALCNPRESHN